MRWTKDWRRRSRRPMWWRSRSRHRRRQATINIESSRQLGEGYGLHGIPAVGAAATGPVLAGRPQSAPPGMQAARAAHERSPTRKPRCVPEAARGRSRGVARPRRMLPRHHFTIFPRQARVRDLAQSCAPRNRAARRTRATRCPHLVGRMRFRRGAVHGESALGRGSSEFPSGCLALGPRHRCRPDHARACAQSML